MPIASIFNYIGVIVLVVLVLILVVSNIHVVQQSRAYVVERLGAYSATWNVGLHLKIPFIERVVKKVSLKEQVADFDPQPVITKDNVTMQIDTVIYFQITDPKLYTYGVEHPMNAIENLTATTLRNIIGEMELDQSLTSRDVINAKMRSILDEATDPWGIKVNRVELKNILPPKEIQNAMEKQMKAERERRESILQAEGQKQSQILVAEGEKQSTILKADAEKQAAILHAEAERQAAVLRDPSQHLIRQIARMTSNRPRIGMTCDHRRMRPHYIQNLENSRISQMANIDQHSQLLHELHGILPRLFEPPLRLRKDVVLSAHRIPDCPIRKRQLILEIPCKHGLPHAEIVEESNHFRSSLVDSALLDGFDS